MADAAVSNTAEGNLVWVRIPPSAPRTWTRCAAGTRSTFGTVEAAVGLRAQFEPELIEPPGERREPEPAAE